MIPLLRPRGEKKRVCYSPVAVAGESDILHGLIVRFMVKLLLVH
jgi:hypothetical protein